MTALVRALGRADYTPVWQDMQAFTAARGADTPDEFWQVEHPPVFTLGLALLLVRLCSALRGVLRRRLPPRYLKPLGVRRRAARQEPQND